LCSGHQQAYPLPCAAWWDWLLPWWTSGACSLPVICVSRSLDPFDCIRLIFYRFTWDQSKLIICGITVTSGARLLFQLVSSYTAFIYLDRLAFLCSNSWSKLIYKLYSYPQLHLYVMHTWPLLSWGSSWNSRTNLRHPQAMVGWVLQELYLSLSCQSCRTMCATLCSFVEACKPASLETCDDRMLCIYNCSNLTFEPG